MKQYNGLNNLPDHFGTAVTIGTFDGVHLGHQKIITSTVQAANVLNGRSVVITFNPYPQQVLRPESNIGLLNGQDEKANALSKLDLQALLILHFDMNLAALSPEEFVKKILVDRLQIKHLVVGYNHAFGKQRQGHEDNLRQLGNQYDFTVSVIAPVQYDNKPISSTRIRNTLLDGDVQNAAFMLGRYHTLSGIVVKGQGIGRKIGFPTANLQLINIEKLIPGDGVYAVRICHQHGWYKGMANIGHKPSIPGSERNIEVNLFDFDENIYNSMITIEFVHRIRDEKRFDSLEVLKAQLCRDQISSLGLLDNTLFQEVHKA
ncbi:bifunctional riboflavin kinase/FAD synthetase [bacterium]|nr:bifunctional riboflavin kinase/FAD synthetase [bacterium]